MINKEISTKFKQNVAGEVFHKTTKIGKWKRVEIFSKNTLNEVSINLEFEVWFCYLNIKHELLPELARATLEEIEACD